MKTLTLILMELVHRYAFPDRFVSGAIGDAAGRVFFVQTRQGSRMTNVVCERQQIRVLADHIGDVLDELGQLNGMFSDSESARSRPVDSDPLDVPLDEDFRAGTMTITWLPESASLAIELFALGVYRKMVGAGDTRTDGKVLQVVITPDQARDFVARTDRLLRSHNPCCPFCSQPIWPGGHLCPRCNGYRKPLVEFV